MGNFIDSDRVTISQKSIEKILGNVSDDSDPQTFARRAYGAIFDAVLGPAVRPTKNFTVPDILPGSYDLRTSVAKPYPVIHDQRKLSACTAFAATAALEFTSRRQRLFPIWSLSPIYLYYVLCSTSAGNSGSAVPGKINGLLKDEGSSLDDAMTALEKGIAPLKDWSLDMPWNMTPDVQAQDRSRAYKATKGSCVAIEQVLDQLLTVLANGLSIAFSFVVSEEGDVWMRSETKQHESNFLYPANWGEQDFPKVKYAHSALLIGYNGLARHFIVRNSWGPKWGTEDGHFYISYGTVTEPFWCRDFFTVLDVDL